MRNKVSIIIVVHNALEFVKITIDSIVRLTDYPYEIIIVDNGSSEITVRYLNSLINKYKIIFNKENKLFAFANNQGILASNNKYKYLILLNSDIEILRHDWLRKMVDLIESEPNIGIVGPKHNYKPIAPIYGAIDGWCFLFKREVLNIVGLFNSEKFPWNGSPNDFTIRAFKKGYIYKHFPNGEKYIYHFGKKSRKENLKMLSNIPYDYELLLKEHGIKPIRKFLLFEKLQKKCCKWLHFIKYFYN